MGVAVVMHRREGFGVLYRGMVNKFSLSDVKPKYSPLMIIVANCTFSDYKL